MLRFGSLDRAGTPQACCVGAFQNFQRLEMCGATRSGQRGWSTYTPSRVHIPDVLSAIRKLGRTKIHSFRPRTIKVVRVLRRAEPLLDPLPVSVPTLSATRTMPRLRPN